MRFCLWLTSLKFTFTADSYRLPAADVPLPKIPIQPISPGDAFHFLKYGQFYVHFYRFFLPSTRFSKILKIGLLLICSTPLS